MKYKLKSTRHATYLLHAHLVFTPKYRKKIFTKEHLETMKEVFENVCKKMDCELVEFNGETDHVHLLIEYPPRLALSKIVNSLKGVSSRILRKKYPVFKKEYWGDNVSLWSRSYFVASVGGAPIEILKEYIENQKAPD
ncbi:IS200/IS605 family transposase [Caminibacter sp.]